MSLADWIERAKRWRTGARPTPRTSAGDSAPRHDGHPTEMRTDHIMCVGPHGIHRMVYYEWGDPTNPKVLLCVHGLTRTGRDFDELARALAPHYRVICPDVVGRGLSDWLTVKTDYTIPLYVSDLFTLLGKIRPKTLHWLGTSMGGLIGMTLAAQPMSPIDKLVLNDVGPVLSAASLERIGRYVAETPHFATQEEAEAYLRRIHAPFGPLTDAQWRHLTLHSVRQDVDGRWVLRYDPGIAVPFQTQPALDVDLWALWDAIRCPTLVLRGAESDLLTRETAEEMTRRGPCAKLVEIPGVGHAPALMDPQQIALVRDFLLDRSSP